MNSLAERTQALVDLFELVARTRMAGVPVLNAALRVEAVGFELVTGLEADEPAAAVGVLLTPWFMNLVWLPLQAVDGHAGVGRVRERTVGTTGFEFIGAHEPGFGGYEACSLSSPMFEYADHAQALATAQAVLSELRPAPEPVPNARRAFLFGRSSPERRA